MTKRLRLLFAFAAVAMVVTDSAGLLWAEGEAVAQSRRRRRKPAPKPQPAPVQQPAPAQQTPPAEPQPEIEIDPGAVEPPVEITPAAPEPVEVTPPTEADKQAQSVAKAASWEDIVVVMRKPFLKDGRIEIQPSWNVTLNDNMIRHHAINGQILYWLTDVLAVGVEGQYFHHFGFLEPHDTVAATYKRLPTLNEYNWGAALNFHYSPIYAKFAVFNKFLVHWEGKFTAGVGVLQTEVLPRMAEFEGWTNLLIAPNVGFEARVFIAKWITLNIGVRDYIFVDKFESVDRNTADVEAAKDAATTQLINNVMFTAGFSFWVPTGFQYTTFR
jgi:outer membrane beta-barrel protein